MSTEHLYKRAERADEVADPDMKDADPKEILAATYDAWLGIFDQYKDQDIRYTIDMLYRQACRLVRPFKEKMAGTITEKELGPIADDPHYKECEDNQRNKSGQAVYRKYCYAGLYLSALLNETDLDRLSIGSFPAKLEEVGYCLQPGKTVEVREDAIVGNVGDAAQGGIGIVRGTCEGNVGWDASGGIFPVFGAVEGCVGYRATGGMFPIFGKVKHSIGNCVTGGIFTVYGTAEGNIGYDAAGGIFIAKQYFTVSMNGTYRVDTEGLEKDAELGRLLDELEVACRAEKFGEVETVARQIDGHVRKNYKRFKERRF